MERARYVVAANADPAQKLNSAKKQVVLKTFLAAPLDMIGLRLLPDLSAATTAYLDIRTPIQQFQYRRGTSPLVLQPIGC